MHENHGGYNTDCWNFFDRDRYKHSPAGGEFSYYTAYDQEHVLDPAGIYGVTFEQAAAVSHITYMLGNDQPSYQTLARIEVAGMASGYRFRINAFMTSADASIAEVENVGVAPIYYDAYVTVNGVRAAGTLRNLAPNTPLACIVSSGGASPIVTIECDRLVAGQVIEYEASLNP